MFAIFVRSARFHIYRLLQKDNDVCSSSSVNNGTEGRKARYPKSLKVLGPFPSTGINWWHSINHVSLDLCPRGTRCLLVGESVYNTPPKNMKNGSRDKC